MGWETGAVQLIRQVSLVYQEGRSDKVYEVDLCEVGPDRYVVNFRYGRRGTALRDGSKTVAPVSRDEAERIFQRLVDEKVGKGYRHAPGSGPPPKPAATPAEAIILEPEDAPALDPRSRAVLARLTQGGDPRGSWPLSRAVWRAGEMKLRQAEPVLIDLIGSGNEMLEYCLAWALGQCGSAASVPILSGLQADRDRAHGIRYMAAQAARNLADSRSRAEMIAAWIDRLPPSLASLAKGGQAGDFQAALLEYLDGADPRAYEVLELIYLIDTPSVRPALLHVLRTAPLAPNYFQRIRHIFKAAEMRRDAEVYGLIGHRIETTRSTFSHTASYYYPRRKKQTLGPNASQAFGRETRLYLRRRLWRTLSRLGELGDLDYARMAAGVLLAFSDDDAQQPRSEVRYDWSSYSRGRGYRSYQIRWDRYAPYWALNQILYHHSPRYRADSGRKYFVCTAPYEPGGEVPDVREEAFPAIWERAPELLLRLLAESRCEPVHNFAAKALRACEDFCRQLPIDALVALLTSDYEVTAALGFDLAVARYDPSRPDAQLVLALANCRIDRARRQAHQWIEAQRTVLFDDTDFAASLCGSPYADTRAVARESLRAVSLNHTMAQALVGRLFALLLSLGSEDGPVAADVAQTLLQVFGRHLTEVGEDVIRDLLAHPLAELQQLAGDLVLASPAMSRHPPSDILQALLSADHAPVRSVGVRIIGQLPDDVLKRSLDLLIALVRHEFADIRQTIRPVVARLAMADGVFGRRIAERLLDKLLVPGAPEGVPSHTSLVLREDLVDCLKAVPAETVWKLLQSRSAPAQEVGGVLLAGNVRVEDLSITEIVRLGSHDILSVREACWKMCRASVARMQADGAAAVRILDARWDDTRRFAADFFREHFTGDHLSPAALVSICDSVRPEVQQLGRELITRHFRDEHGQEYLLKLSQHPTTALQLFATNYLERYAGGSPGRLAELTPYFRSVLSRVNRGRVAKARVLDFLEVEAAKSEEAAHVVADLLARQSVTGAIGDRARMIQIMADMAARYPAIPLPLEVQPVEVRGGV